jgi:DNA-binding transcriptional ArsR family regulator
VTTYHEAQLDALGDATRRAILTRLRPGPLSVGALAEKLPISRPAVSQHLRILKEAHLVTDHASGTRRLYSIDSEGFRALREYFDQFWTAALSEFKKKIEERQR